MIKVNVQNKKVLIFKDNELFLAFYYLAGEFVCDFCSSKPLVVSKKENIDLYNKINSIMDNNYVFDDKNIKTQNKLVWQSDQSKNKNTSSLKNKFIIEKFGELYKISCSNQQHSNYSKIIVFSINGNGRYSLNLETGSTFQDDMEMVFFQSFTTEYGIKEKIKSLFKR